MFVYVGKRLLKRPSKDMGNINSTFYVFGDSENKISAMKSISSPF